MPEPAPERTQEITIRWRRYGRTGGKWRADFPPGNGIDSGVVESSSLDIVERFAAVVAERYGYPIVRRSEGCTADIPCGEQTCASCYLDPWEGVSFAGCSDPAAVAEQNEWNAR